MLSTSFDFFVEHLVANLLHKSRHTDIDAASSHAAGSLVRARVQIDVDKWNVEKTRHAACNQVFDQVCSWNAA